MHAPQTARRWSVQPSLVFISQGRSVNTQPLHSPRRARGCSGTFLVHRATRTPVASLLLESLLPSHAARRPVKGTAVWREDQASDGLPRTSHEEWPLSDARRTRSRAADTGRAMEARRIFLGSSRPSRRGSEGTASVRGAGSSGERTWTLVKRAADRAVRRGAGRPFYSATLRRADPTQDGVSVPRCAKSTSCRLHGGKSTGLRTQEGLEHSRSARWLGRLAVANHCQNTALTQFTEDFARGARGRAARNDAGSATVTRPPAYSATPRTRQSEPLDSF